MICNKCKQDENHPFNKYPYVISVFEQRVLEMIKELKERVEKLEKERTSNEKAN